MDPERAHLATGRDPLPREIHTHTGKVGEGGLRGEGGREGVGCVQGEEGVLETGGRAEGRGTPHLALPWFSSRRKDEPSSALARSAHLYFLPIRPVHKYVKLKS